MHRGVVVDVVAFVQEHKRAPSQLATSRAEVALDNCLLRHHNTRPPISIWGIQKLNAAWSEATGARCFPRALDWSHGVRSVRAAEKGGS